MSQDALSTILDHRYDVIAKGVSSDTGLDMDEILDTIAEQAAEDELYGRGIHISPLGLLIFGSEIKEIKETRDFQRAVHLAMDIAGSVPGFGEPFDLANAILYLAWDRPSKTFYAFLSLLGAIPLIGSFFVFGKVPVRLIATNAKAISSMIDALGSFGGLEKHIPELRRYLDQIITSAKAGDESLEIPAEYLAKSADSAATVAAQAGKAVSKTSAVRTIVDELGSIIAAARKVPGNSGDVLLFRGTTKAMDTPVPFTAADQARWDHIWKLIGGYHRSGKDIPPALMREGDALWTKARASTQFFTDSYEQARFYATGMGKGSDGFISAIRVPGDIAFELGKFARSPMPGPHGLSATYELSAEMIQKYLDKIVRMRVPGIVYDGAAMASHGVTL
jgi:hypothetical protein